MNKRSIGFKVLAVVLSGLLLTACSNSSSLSDSNPPAAGTETGNGSNNQSIGAITLDKVTYDNDDYYSDWKNENPTYIKLNGNSAGIEGTGAAVDGSQITITAGGVYVVSGHLEDGQIIVNAKDQGTVRLILNGAEIKCSNSAPIYVQSADKAVISLGEGTENVLTDGDDYVLADAESDEPSGALFSKADLSINGTGRLTVQGNYNDGVVSKDDLKITGGTIRITAVDDGLIGRDMVAVKEGELNIEAGGDGIKSTNDTDADKGFIVLEGGTFSIKSGADGIQAETSMLVTGGEFTLVTNGGNTNGTVKTENNGPMGGRENPQATTTADAEAQSAKGLKASADITISGGTFKIDSADDAVHTNDSMTIAGGDFSITSGDDGIHADSTITINGGKINIEKSYEGIESAQITINGGEMHVIASDDGINVAGGNDGSAVNGRPGQNTFSSAGNNKLTINEGYISVSAAGDGLDANGSIAVTGGTVIVNGPTNSGNGALDYDGTFEVSGGLIIAAGSSGMAQAPTDQSVQYAVAMTYSTVQQAGTLVHLEDSQGNTIVTFAPEKQYQFVVISSAELKKDTEYTLYSGGTATGNNKDGLYSGGNYGNGNKVVTFTLSSLVTWLNESGVTTGGGGNPGAGFGGGQGGFGGGQGGFGNRQGGGNGAPQGGTAPGQ